MKIKMSVFDIDKGKRILYIHKRIRAIDVDDNYLHIWHCCTIQNITNIRETLAMLKV